MRTLRFTSMLLLLLACMHAALSLGGEARRTSVFRVQNLTCALCGKPIDRAVRAVSGVQSVVIDAKEGRVTVVAEPGVAPSAIRAAIESAGDYAPELVQTP